MKNEMLKQKLDRLQITRLPRWTDLPDLALYMDQVVSYINQYLDGLNLDEITAAMINNYVKKGIVTAPSKKRYTKSQIAQVLIIALLKTSFSIEEIKQLIIAESPRRNEKQLYDYFILTFLAAIHQLDADYSPYEKSKNPAGILVTETEQTLLKLACQSVVYKIAIRVTLKKTNTNSRE
ncbi:DUF1836 domain-containing protein [Latilactobacillus graminis]|uniref:DUF1836 domain-containing protein n=2 Tax=Latilactobacillus graminis TaxID=60519 RepID=A0AA89I327_9LACO|nr:DUF1836 domain-containing protein [Latilactobacillus graminis]KRM23806.1 hypothetical protein FC90_GL001326 [Latilactobacillus graminis DSM 20719]QFP79697.1 DUF1836 domain-containing protein [Latilactobacillus graminis]